MKSTSQKFVESISAKQRKKFDEEYRELLLSELLLAAMEQDDISVRKLAKKGWCFAHCGTSNALWHKKRFQFTKFF